jgi:antitoxin component YwqK of YwqJK toxin-antitoxin module
MSGRCGGRIAAGEGRAMDKIDLNSDAVTWDGDQRLLYRDEPFTGEAVETIGSRIISQTFYIDGIPDGIDREWWSDGSPKSEGQNNHGLAVGTFRNWYVNGQLESEEEFAGDGTLLSRRKWDKDGNPVQPKRCRLAHGVPDE